MIGAWLDCLGAVCLNQVVRDATVSISACRMLPCKIKCWCGPSNVLTRTISASRSHRIAQPVFLNKLGFAESHHTTGTETGLCSSNCVFFPCHRVHGKNRLGGNSLLECVVFGRIAGREAAAHVLHVYEQQQYQRNSDGPS